MPCMHLLPPIYNNNNTLNVLFLTYKYAHIRCVKCMQRRGWLLLYVIITLTVLAASCFHRMTDAHIRLVQFESENQEANYCFSSARKLCYFEVGLWVRRIVADCLISFFLYFSFRRNHNNKQQTHPSYQLFINNNRQQRCNSKLHIMHVTLCTWAEHIRQSFRPIEKKFHFDLPSNSSREVERLRFSTLVGLLVRHSPVQSCPFLYH